MATFLEQVLGKLAVPRVSFSQPEPQPDLVEELLRVSDLALANDRGPRVDCVRSLLLLQAGEFERSHSIVQAMSGSDPAYIHGMIHRAEGDFWNAKYWFRRSKKHPAFLGTPINPFSHHVVQFAFRNGQQVERCVLLIGAGETDPEFARWLAALDVPRPGGDNER